MDLFTHCFLQKEQDNLKTWTGIAIRQGPDFDKSRYVLGMCWVFGTIPNYLSKGGGVCLFPGGFGFRPIKGRV